MRSICHGSSTLLFTYPFPWKEGEIGRVIDLVIFAISSRPLSQVSFLFLDYHILPVICLFRTNIFLSLLHLPLPIIRSLLQLQQLGGVICSKPAEKVFYWSTHRLVASTFPHLVAA